MCTTVMECGVYPTLNQCVKLAARNRMLETVVRQSYDTKLLGTGWRLTSEVAS
jgi:hypothetical protein